MCTFLLQNGALQDIWCIVEFVNWVCCHALISIFSFIWPLTKVVWIFKLGITSDLISCKCCYNYIHALFLLNLLTDCGLVLGIKHLGQHLFMQWFVACMAITWNTVDLLTFILFGSNFSQGWMNKNFWYQNSFENIVSKIGYLLFRPQCVNLMLFTLLLIIKFFLYDITCTISH